jgi:hypothetical protein
VGSDPSEDKVDHN